MGKKRWKPLSSYTSTGKRDVRQFKGTTGWHPGMGRTFPPPPRAVWEQIKTPPAQAVKTKER